VVDDDIDVWDDFAVDWALSWHVRPDKDIYIERDVQAVGSILRRLLPPCCNIIRAGTWVTSAIDATENTISAISLPPKNTWIW